MKQKDFFSQLAKQGNITDAEAIKFIESVPDFEIPQEFVSSFEDSFLTRQRAIADRAINNEIWAKALDPVDRQIEKITEILEPIDKDIVNDIRWAMKEIVPGKPKPDTFKQLGILSGKLPQVFQKLKATPDTDENTKKELAALQKSVQEYNDKFAALQKERDEQLKTVNSEWGQKFEDYQLSTELEKLTNKYTLAEAFEKTRTAINKVTLAEVRASHKLKLGEKDGHPVIHVLNEDGTPKFNGNNPVLIDTVLDDAYKPFLKRSDTGNGQGNPKPSTTSQPPQNPGIRTGASTAVRVR